VPALDVLSRLALLLPAPLCLQLTAKQTTNCCSIQNKGVLNVLVNQRILRHCNGGFQRHRQGHREVLLLAHSSAFVFFPSAALPDTFFRCFCKAGANVLITGRNSADGTALLLCLARILAPIGINEIAPEHFDTFYTLVFKCNHLFVLAQSRRAPKSCRPLALDTLFLLSAMCR
jgi:hypothetical protein